MLGVIHNARLDPAQTSKLQGQATELEGMFLNTLVKEMFASIKTDKQSLGGGFAEDTWRGMQAEQLSTSMARNGGIGLADRLMGDLVALQEAAQNPINTPSASQGAYSK